MKRVVIVGGGPGGLSAAFRLKKNPNVSVAVLEKEAEPGGRVKSMDLPQGFAADRSAQSYARNYTNTLALFRELHIENHLDPVDERKFFALFRDGAMQPLPTGLGSFLATRTLTLGEKACLALFGVSAILRSRRGGMVNPGLYAAQDRVSLSGYSVRAFGQKSTDEIVRAGVSMLMADLEEVSLAFAYSLFPLMMSPHMVLRHGNGTFTAALAAECGDVRLQDAAASVRIRDRRVLGVETEKGGFLEADHVVVATRARQAAEVLGGLGEEERAFLAEIPYSTCLQVVFGAPRPYLPCWGMFFPPAAGTFIASLTEESFKSPGRAPAGHGLTQAFITGKSARDMMDESDDAIVEKTHQEVLRLFPDYPGERLFGRVVRQREAMVIPYPGFYGRMREFRSKATAVRGLHLVGDYVSNPVIEASVTLAERAAAEILRG